MQTTGLGVLGETYAADYLRRTGYIILDRNFTSRFGEIDIIAQHGHFLCFVEVKTRGVRALGRPAEAVTPAKQQKLWRTAEYYLARHRALVTRRDLQPRFDVIEVYADADGRPCRLNHLENAF